MLIFGVSLRGVRLERCRFERCRITEVHSIIILYIRTYALTMNEYMYVHAVQVCCDCNSKHFKTEMDTKPGCALEQKFRL